MNFRSQTQNCVGKIFFHQRSKGGIKTQTASTFKVKNGKKSHLPCFLHVPYLQAVCKETMAMLQCGNSGEKIWK